MGKKDNHLKERQKRYTANFPVELMEVRRQWSDIFEVAKENNCQFIARPAKRKKNKDVFKIHKRENLPLANPI